MEAKKIKNKIVFRILAILIVWQIVSFVFLRVFPDISKKTDDVVFYILAIISFCFSVFLIVKTIRKGMRELKILHIQELIKVLSSSGDNRKISEAISIMKDELAFFKSDDSDALFLKNDAHQKFLARIIEDGKITDNEMNYLNFLENAIGISSSEKKKNRREAYMIAYNWAIKDRELTEYEEDVLSNIFFKLGINAEDVKEEQNFVKELSLARTLVGKNLMPVSVPFNLKGNEQCYYKIMNTGFYKSIQHNYEICPKEEPEIFGVFYVTNQRIIISSPGEFERSLNSIDIVSNWDDYFIKITFRGKERPFFLKTPNPYLTRVIIVNYINKARS